MGCHILKNQSECLQMDMVHEDSIQGLFFHQIVTRFYERRTVTPIFTEAMLRTFFGYI